MRCPEEAGRFQTNINILIISLKGTEAETSVQGTGRERLGKWKCERGPREAGRARSGGKVVVSTEARAGAALPPILIAQSGVTSIIPTG